jgi:Fungal fucose-specific lectin
MNYHTSSTSALHRLHHAARTLALLICLAALPAYAQTIHQFSYNNSIWQDQNLFGAVTNAQTGVAAFVTTPNDGPHAFYLASDDHVHQLFNNGTSWSDQDLTSQTGAPAALFGSAISGFSVQNFQYVYYIGVDLHLHQLLYNNSNWADSDLTVITSGPLSSSTTQLVAFTTGSPAVHVYFTAASGHIHQTYTTTGSNWQDQDLTSLTGGTFGGSGWMAGFNIGNFQYVYFIANTNHVHQFLYNNSTWTDEDLTTLSKSAAAVPGSGVAALVIPGTKKLRVYVIGANRNDILQLASSNGKTWTSSDLCKKAKAPPASAGPGLVAFATTPNNQIHVFYSTNDDLYQLFLPTPSTKWQFEDLTTEYGGGSMNTNAGMAGYSLQNLQYVYYVAQ